MMRAAAAVACIGSLLLCAGPATAKPRRSTVDGGSGTFVAAGRTVYFTLLNTGTTLWQSFDVVGPPGTVFLSGLTASETSVRCFAGQPDGLANEIQCGPLSLNAAPPQLHLSFVATFAAPVDCNAVFQLAVSSTSVPPYTRPADITGVCASAPPMALGRPTIHGTPAVGHTLTAAPPTWSATPTHVTYRWQRCKAASCAPITGANRLKLVLGPADAGRSVRIVATALIGSTTVESSSKKLAVR